MIPNIDEMKDIALSNINKDIKNKLPSDKFYG